MKNFTFFILFSLCSIFSIAQTTQFSIEVLHKMDQNKINNLPIFDGIEFIYKVSISSELLMGNINNDDLLLANSINEVKQNLGYNNVYYYRDENLNLFLQFKDDTENSLDDLKRALTNKNIKPNGFSLYARLKY